MVVLCDGGRHKVRLQGGFHFLASAKCPKCAARVDPWRWRRCLTIAMNLRAPRSPVLLDRVVWIGAIAALALAIVTAGLFWFGADQWWPATLLLFGPRWVLLLPLAPLLIVLTIRDRLSLLTLTLAVIIVVFPIMGMQAGMGGLVVNASDDDLIVVSFNAKGGETLTQDAAKLLSDWQTDIAAFQECGRRLRRQLRDIAGWHVHGRGSLCLASRFEILDFTMMDRANLESVGGSGLVATYTVASPGTPIRITNVHLETPRAGLELIRRGRLREGVEILRQKSILREIELRLAQRWAQEAGGPGIIVGDFNTPAESRHFRREFGGWTNTFSFAGRGFGGTRLNGWIRARIDHILVDDQWSIVSAWVGEDVGSDHLPILARVRVR